MGYAIAVPCRSRKAQARMVEFLSLNYRPFHTFMGLSWETSGIHGPLTEKELVYDRGKCRIGFEYGAGGRDREYGFCVVRWIARKIGRRRAFKGIPEPVPYYVYDGYEAVPLLLWGQKVDAKWGWARVKNDCTAMDHLRYRKFTPRMYEAHREINRRIGEEILRLNTLWVQEVLHGR